VDDGVRRVVGRGGVVSVTTSGLAAATPATAPVGPVTARALVVGTLVVATLVVGAVVVAVIGIALIDRVVLTVDVTVVALFAPTSAAASAASTAPLVRGRIALIVVGVARGVVRVVVVVVLIVVVHVGDRHRSDPGGDERDGLRRDEQRHVGRWCGARRQRLRDWRWLGIHLEGLRGFGDGGRDALGEEVGGLGAQLRRHILVAPSVF
jgi:hypothetical protein